MINLRVPLLYAAALLCGCSSDDTDAPADQPDTGAESPEAGSSEAAPVEFALTSAAFENGGMMPPAHRCNDSPSPPLAWTAGPAGTESYAIVMRDLDFMGGFLHWIIYDIPATTTELPEGIPLGFEPGTPAGAKQPMVLSQGYFGPCSPVSVNTYEFTLYALGVAALPDVTETSTGTEVATAIEAHALAETSLQVESGP